MADDKRDRKASPLDDIAKRRFEHEVAEEIGISLDRKLNRRRSTAGNRTTGPAANEPAGGPRDRGRRRV